MDVEKLKEYLAEGKSTNEIAPLMGLKSGSTVRFWMKKYDLESPLKGGNKSKHLEIDGIKTCSRCNTDKDKSEFRSRSDRNGTLNTYC